MDTTVTKNIITPDKNWLSLEVAPPTTLTVVLSKVLEHGSPPTIPHTKFEIESPKTSLDWLYFVDVIFPAILAEIRVSKIEMKETFNEPINMFLYGMLLSR